MVSLFSFLLRLTVLAFATVMVAGATLTVAAERVDLKSQRPTLAPVTQTAPANLAVPDVRGQAYVFAKGILQDAGFAWHVAGDVQGYAANVVDTQDPAAGTEVAGTGAPLVTLTLSRNAAYSEGGTPQNDSPYPATETKIVGAPPTPVTPVTTEATPTPAGTTPADTTRTDTAPTQTAPTDTTATVTAPAQTVVAAAPQAPPTPTETTPVSPPLPATTSAAAPPVPPSTPPASHANDFTVPGAPTEPAGETLPGRAHALATWLASHQDGTAVNLNYWLYEHAYLVAGARFGWWHGADALRVLIAVDRRVETLWHVGPASEQTARDTLAQVQAAATK